MKTILKITKNELSTLFYSPIAWLILIIFTFQSGMAYAEAWGDALRSQALGYTVIGATRRLLLGWQGAISSMQEHLFLYIPLLTMGLMSQEYNRGSIKLLYSSPITNRQIIFGKYLSMIVYALILVAILFVYYAFTAFTIKDIDSSFALTALLGIFLMICAYAAIGLFMSSLTSYQVVAAVGTLAILAVLNYIGNVGQEIPFVRDITYWLSISGRADTFFKGLITSEDLLYFLLVIILFIIFSILRLQSERTKRTTSQSALRYGGIIVVTLLIGYVSSRPALRCYYDATEMKDNTLTQNSLDVMEQLDGPLTITSYVNILDEDYFRVLPRYHNQDIERFEKYIRFKPEIKMKYVYYYDKVDNPSLDQRYPGLSDEQRAQKICEALDWNIDQVLNPEQIRQTEDLSAEYNKFVRVLERGNGQKSYLRLYDDNMRFPTETEITAALKRMVVKAPLVAFVTGHGERNINGGGDRDYYAFSQYKGFRNSLINQGFDITTLALDTLDRIPDEVDILVISDIRTPLSSKEQGMIDGYIAEGRNLIIAGEPRRQEQMNHTLANLGLSFMPGILVQESKDYPADLILSSITKAAEDLSKRFSDAAYFGYKITMPSTVGIKQIEEKGFTIIPLMTTDSTGSWSELETTNFVEDTTRINLAIGEIEQANVTMMYLTRQINGKKQGIIVLGDADCIGNGELTRQRNGIESSNFTVVTESFRLLTNGEYPIDTNRKRSSDNKVYLNEKSGVWLKILFMGVFPGILTFLSLALWWRRRKK
ncbi:Gldg family protein [Butyricimonas hominis]|uniref:Gldg family protein n=1 Tax=Butyricimonas hominis TaxID=2763032 RepID=A0ABR7D327_9BACT|nr:Gldg family protein [Butyricimonas hominis]MBC5622340.1 Gldg family protein [Butyricimonas hominis]